MAQFRSKIVTIDAVRWNGATVGLTNGGEPFSLERLELPDWMPTAKVVGESGALPISDAPAEGEVWRSGDFLYIGTLEGTHRASPGDWIIRGLRGELYPCKPDVFFAKYAPADAAPAPLLATTEYISTKRVSAEPEARDGIDGMKIIYVDGYVSWCPLNVFQRDYQSIMVMSFGHALFAMSKGAKVARIGWNGKGMWICQGEGVVANPAPRFWNKHTRAFAEANDGFADVLPYLIMKTADGKILMGWLASQTDMLANDWQVVL